MSGHIFTKMFAMIQLLTRFFATVFLFGAGLVFALPSDEQSRRDQYLQTPLTVEGFVVDEQGRRVEAAAVELGNFVNGTIQVSASTTTNQFGYYSVATNRHNAQLRIVAAGFRESVHYLHLVLPATIEIWRADPVVLAPTRMDETRYLFGGDLTWGRRLLGLRGTVSEQAAVDAGGQFPPADFSPGLVDLDNPLPGTLRTISYVRPYFDQADVRSVVLHSPSLDVSTQQAPSNRHPNREFTYFHLPGSLDALNVLGVDYVALGNDHLFDHLEPALELTLDDLDARGIQFSGAAALSRVVPPQTVEQAASAAAYFPSLNSSMLSFTSIGFRADPKYVANDDDLKGGAAFGGTAPGGVPNYRQRYFDAVQAETDQGRDPIVQLHMGFSNSFWPSGLLLTRTEQAADAGSPLIIGHHAHLAHGFEFIARADRGPALAMHGLGNLIYDQNRLETAVGLLGEADLASGEVSRARALPVYLKGFVPRPAVGGLATTTLARSAELSQGRFPESAGDARLTILNNKAWILPNQADNGLGIANRTETQLSVELDGSGQAVVDLRHLPGFVSQLRVSPQIAVKGGFDLLRFGQFEDWDVDEETFELEQWSVDDQQSFACTDQPRSGVAALCIDSSSTQSGEETVRNRAAVRVPLQFATDGSDPMPLSDLSILGWLRAEQSGPISIKAIYRASRGRECASQAFVFGEQTIVAEAATTNTLPWTKFGTALSWPADPAPVPQVLPGECETESVEFDWEFDTPRAMNLEIGVDPSNTVTGRLAVDDLAVIYWQESFNHNGTIDLTAPNASQFFQLSGAPNATVELSVTTVMPMPTNIINLGQPGPEDVLFSDGFEAVQ